MLTFDAAPDELQLFLEESEEQLQLLDQDIVLLEKEGPRPELLQEIFRAAHTLKGSSAAIGHAKMAALTHSMENVLEQLRAGRLECGAGLIDTLLQSLDGLRLLKVEVATLQDSGFDPVELVCCLDAILVDGSLSDRDQEGMPARADSPGPADLDGGVRVLVKIAEDSPLPAARCLQLYLEACRFGQVVACCPSLEEMESQRAQHQMEMLVHPTAAIQELTEALSAVADVVDVVASPAESPHADGSGQGEVASREDGQARSQTVEEAPQQAGREAPAGRASSAGLGKTVRIDVARLDDLMNLVGELVIDRTRLTQLGQTLRNRSDDDSVRELVETSLHIGRIVDELQEGIMKARMLPVASLFNRLPRVVRDLAQRAAKKIDFVVEGEDTELDRSVIEELHDPLVHLLRNAVDHGVETPERRHAAGKTPVGRIRLSAMHRENRIVLQVEDDGSGIDIAKVRMKAVQRQLIPPEAVDRLSDQEVVQMIFAPGFSTAETISDVSGRGVGMDIVRTNIEKLNGAIHVDTRPGRGTRFTLELPLTLAIIDALMVGLGGEVIAIPLVSVVETLRVRRSEIHWINGHQAIRLRDSVLPLIELGSSLGLSSTGGAGDRVFVVAARAGDHRAGLVVDSLLGELQVVVKSLGRLGGSTAGITGATILGDGRVALILDVPSLVKCIVEEQSRGWAA